MNYPFHPGSYGSDTSNAAAEAIAKRAPIVAKKVLFKLDAAPFGLTAHQVADALGCENTTSQPRLTELLLNGYVADSGERRKNQSGRPARVWIITDKGRAFLRGASAHA